MQLNLKVAQLISSRLCHDLVGPAGAVQNGIELFEEMDFEGDESALKIVANSGEQLLARLAFFRLTFGNGGLNGKKSPLAEARDVSKAYLKGSRISLEWKLEINTCLEKTITVPAVKLLLNMIFVAIDGLPRGGTLAVSELSLDESHKEPTVRIVVKASGPGACFNEDLKFVLSSENSSSLDPNLSAHNIHAFFCQRLAENQLSKIETFTDHDEVKLAVSLPQPLL